MVYISSWAAYQSAAEALYERAPDRTRYCVKWKPSEGKLVLKITDDTTCLKYKTHSSIFLNRFEALNLSLMQKMQNTRVRATSPSAQATRGAKPSVMVGEEQEVHGSRAGTPGPGAAGVTLTGGGVQGGVKKRKGKKKK